MGRASAEDQGPGQPDRSDRDGRDGQTDAGDGGAVGEVEAGLQPVPARGADRGERLGQPAPEGDDDADDRPWAVRPTPRRLDGRRDEPWRCRRRRRAPPPAGPGSPSSPGRWAGARARRRRAPGRRGPRAGSSRGAARSGRRRRCRTEQIEATAAKVSCAAVNSGPGWLVVNVGSTRLIVARVADGREGAAGALGVEDRRPAAQGADQQAQSDDAVAGDHDSGEDGVPGVASTSCPRRPP